MFYYNSSFSCNYYTAAKQQINEEFKKNKIIEDPITVQNVCIQIITY